MTSSDLSTLPSFIGRLRIEDVLGRGGFGVVVAAYDEALDTMVAVKVLDHMYTLDLEVRERFLHEGRLMRRVRHPSVLTVHDVGELADGRPYLVTDLATGGSLTDRLARGPGDTRLIVAVGDTLASGVGALHAAGIIHRDIAPSNLLLLGPGDDRIVVADLGLAKDEQRSAYGPTLVGGSPHYRAPEQSLVGGTIGVATDIYGCTAVIWRIVTGTIPPPSEQIASRAAALDVPWRRFFEQGLASEPGERFVDLTQWHRSFCAAVANAGSVAVAIDVTTDACPYKGLAHYDEHDVSIFFGRASLADELVVRLNERRVVVVGGPSGSGKSSLVRAGLLPRLRSGALVGSSRWSQVVMTPGRHPLRDLQRCVAKLLNDTGPTDEQRCEIIVVDQLEELFSPTTDPPERDRFLGELAHLVESNSSIRIVLVLRADFYVACAAYPWLTQALNSSHVFVGRMGRQEMRSAIEGPARAVGLRLEHGLTDMILDDAGVDPGVLPLVAHALVETWIRRRGSQLTLQAYRATGGVVGALAQRAEHVWASLSEEEQTVTRLLLLELVEPGRDSPDSRRRLHPTSLSVSPLQARMLNRLIQARLVTSDERDVMIAHEALLGSWPRYARWIDEVREDLRQRNRLTRLADEWELRHHDPDLLIRGGSLVSALGFNSRSGDTSPTLTRFLDASKAAETQADDFEREREQRIRRLRRRGLITVSLLATSALFSTVVVATALRQSRADQHLAEFRFSRSLAVTAQATASTDPLLATALSLESEARTYPAIPEARAALVSARISLASGGITPIGEPLDVGDGQAIALSPDGMLLAVGRRDGTVDLWNTRARQVRRQLIGPAGGIEKLDFDSQRRWLLASSDDEKVWRWDIAPPAETQSANGIAVANLHSVVWSVAFSPDGVTFASATEDGTVRLHDSLTGTVIGQPVLRHTGDAISVAFVADLLVAGTGNGDLYAWTLPNRAPRFGPLRAHTSDVWTIADAGQNIATVSSDGTVRLWDRQTGLARPGPLDEGAMRGNVRVTDVVVDGATMVLGGSDGRLHAWSLEGGLVATAATHAQGVTAIARSDDGSRLASLADDHTVRLWTQNARRAVSSVVLARRARLYGLARTPNYTIVGDDSGVVYVIDDRQHKVRARITVGASRVFAIATLSPDHFVTGDSTGTLKEWDLNGNLLAKRSSAHSAAITSIAATSGSFVSVDETGVVLHWTTSDLKPFGDNIAPVEGGATDVAFSHDGRILAVASRRGELRAFVRNSRSGPLRQLPFIKASMNTVWSVAFSNDDRFVVTTDDDRDVTIWKRTSTGLRMLRKFSGHAAAVTDAVFLDDGSLAVSTRGGDLYVWDVESGLALSPPIHLHHGAIWHLVASPDNTVMSVGVDGVVRLFDATDVALACRIAWWSFAVNQRRRYLDNDAAAACHGLDLRQRPANKSATQL
jgi:WD40 repeat protein/serine/threonine protein kinase